MPPTPTDRFRRVILVVLDSVGVGAMPDASDFGDPPGADTLGNIARARPMALPNLRRLGIANIRPIHGIAPVDPPAAAFGKCALASPGKDTTTGHWELAGIHLDKPFPLYPRGFPAEVMDAFERAIGRPTLGNKPASGTEIIRELGAEHLRTGAPIVYTSADSVFQIAAHEDVVPVAELYRMCEQARAILAGPHEVGRVIARPFVGVEGAFTRTANRHDYAVPPPPGMLLDVLPPTTTSVGKISDMFLGRGIARQIKTKSNADGMARILEAMATQPDGLIFANLVDFDSLFGHRNDVEGYARALEDADAWIPSVESALGPGDLLILTADHGCDPTTPGTDHTREFVPVLAAGPSVPPADLGVRATLSDVGQTIAHNFGASIPHGTSFLPRLLA
jgi:phosphopentomutase